MGTIIGIVLPLVAKYGPQLIADIVSAFQKAGYTIEQVDAIFAQVKPYDQLGINPNAPVQPEAAAPTPPSTPPAP